MYSLRCDVYLTRRQRMHYVTDNVGNLLFSGKDILGALEFLLEHGEPEFRIEGQDRDEVFIATIRPG